MAHRRLSAKTSIAIVDPHASVRETIKLILAEDDRFHIIAEEESGLAGLAAARRLAPHLVILDLLLPELSGLEILRSLRTDPHPPRVLVFSAAQNENLVHDALRERPHGYVHKRDSLAILRQALVTVASGGLYWSSFATDMADLRKSSHSSSWDSLSGNERAIIQMVAEGSSNKEIATRLHLSTKTVEHYRSRVMQKLNLLNVTALTRFAISRGLIAAD